MRPGETDGTAAVLEDALVQILVCPIDKRGLLYLADEALLYNPRLRRRYQIEGGVPVMLAQGAVPVTEAEHQRLMRRARNGEAAGTAGQSAARIAAAEPAGQAPG
jgi:uncharacterized protein YbaR (Trm112 family)